MAFLSILTGGSGRKTMIRDKDDSKDLLMVDAVLEEAPTYETDITDHVVEDGGNISDNARTLPVKLKITGTVSDSPISLAASLQGAAAAASSFGVSKALSATPVGKSLGGFGSQAGTFLGSVGGSKLASKLFSGSQSPSKDAYTLLTDQWRSKRAIVIVTGLTKYPPMMIQSLSFPRDPSTGGQLKFSMDLKEIRTVSSRKVSIDLAKTEVKHTAGEKTETGTQNAATASTERRSSLLKGMGKIGTKFFSGGA